MHIKYHHKDEAFGEKRVLYKPSDELGRIIKGYLIIKRKTREEYEAEQEVLKAAKIASEAAAGASVETQVPPASQYQIHY